MKFAYTNYNKNKINFREQKSTEEKAPRKIAPKKHYRVTRTVHLEDLSLNGIMRSLREISQQHTQTEERIIKELLDSPFLHVDETQVNIDNVNQYVWVFTNGKYVIFKHTETREASFVHEFLAQYTGVLISDFYSGFDALSCKHQKCWVHIIRDLNNDLWANPFDAEFGNFVSEVKDLIVPIMESIQRHGLKKRYLNKFKNNDVVRFYFKTIIEHSYDSELCSQFQERFIGYRESLFTFLEYDGIPWHNNTAENAIQHIILQMDISGRLHQSAIKEYLILLGIRQTCKFQNKSFLQFLLSGGRDVDFFNASTSKKHHMI